MGIDSMESKTDDHDAMCTGETEINATRRPISGDITKTVIETMTRTFLKLRKGVDAMKYSRCDVVTNNPDMGDRN